MLNARNVKKVKIYLLGTGTKAVDSKHNGDSQARDLNKTIIAIGKLAARTSTNM
jgi:hypothetical protein